MRGSDSSSNTLSSSALTALMGYTDGGAGVNIKEAFYDPTEAKNNKHINQL